MLSFNFCYVSVYNVFFILIFIFICVHLCLCTVCVPHAYGSSGEGGGMDPFELKLMYNVLKKGVLCLVFPSRIYNKVQANIYSLACAGIMEKNVRDSILNNITQKPVKWPTKHHSTSNRAVLLVTLKKRN